VNSESLKNPWNPKSIKTADLQSQTKSENQRKSRTPRNPRNPKIYCILAAVPEFHEFWILEESTKISTAERIQEILRFFRFLWILDFLEFLWFSDLVWLCKSAVLMLFGFHGFFKDSEFTEFSHYWNIIWKDLNFELIDRNMSLSISEYLMHLCILKSFIDSNNFKY
jgi:hypothetical protein